MQSDTKNWREKKCTEIWEKVSLKFARSSIVFKSQKNNFVLKKNRISRIFIKTPKLFSKKKKKNFQKIVYIY